MGEIHVHEFASLDGVIDAPIWTFEYGFDPQMGEAIGAVTGHSRGILLGRTTYEMFEPAWSTRTVDDDPGAPFFNDTMKYVVSSTLETGTWRNSEIIGGYDADVIRRLKDDVGDLYVSGSGTRAGDARRRAGRRPPPLRLPPHPRVGPAALPRDRGARQVVARKVRAVRQRGRLPPLSPGRLRPDSL